MHVNGVLSGHDIRDGGPGLLGVPLGLGLWVVLRHFNGLQKRPGLAQLFLLEPRGAEEAVVNLGDLVDVRSAESMGVGEVNQRKE